MRFKDSSTAQAYFAHEKATATTTAQFWPVGNGTHAEGDATGLGASSVSIEFTGGFFIGDYCAFWVRAAFISSYCSIMIAFADGKKGAMAVDARLPAA
jgi:hypothetical protein